MIIQFEIKNSLCFKERIVLNLKANLKIKKNLETLQQIERKNLALLPLCIIYGKNEVGKTSLFKAIQIFQKIILGNSAKYIAYNEQETLFLIEFYAGKTLYY